MHPILFSNYHTNIENNQHNEYEPMECESVDYQSTEFQPISNFMDSTSINGFGPQWRSRPISNFMDDNMSTFVPFLWNNNDDYDIFSEIK